MQGSDLKANINIINQKASQYIQYAEDLNSLNVIKSNFDAPVYKVPIEQRSVFFTSEGVETPYADLERVDLGLSVPAKNISWNLRDGNYRLTLKLAQPGVINVYSDTTLIIKNRRIVEEAVLDTQQGNIRIESTTNITFVSVDRYTRRSKGSITIGPFRADGVIKATAVGHGDWTCQVAYDYTVNARIHNGAIESVSPNPLDPCDLGIADVVQGPDRLIKPRTRIPWSIASQFDSSLAKPEFKDALIAGKYFTEFEDIYHDGESPLKITSDEYWAGIGRWTLMDSTQAPDMDDTPGWWTYVWGTVSDIYEDRPRIERVYNMRTGDITPLVTAATVPGFYIVKATGLSITDIKENIVITGTNASFGEPIRSVNSALTTPHNNAYFTETPFCGAVQPGDFRKLSYTVCQPRFLIKITGCGILRGIDIQVASNIDRPDLTPVLDIFREDMASYKDPNETWVPNRKQVGPINSLSLPI